MKQNALLKIIILLLLTTLTACSTPAKQTVTTKNTVETADKKSTKKHGGHGKHKPKTGVLSLDVYQDGKTIHILTGTSRNGIVSLWHQKSDSNGKRWSEPVKVDTGEAEIKFRRGNDAQISALGDNIIIASMNRGYTNRHGSGPMTISYSQDGGKHWTSGIGPTDIPKGPHAFIELESNQSGTHLVWLDSRLGKQALFYSQTTDGGATWSSDKTLDDKTCACCWNTMKTDKNNELFVLYRDKEPSDMAMVKIDAKGGSQRINRVGEFDWDFDGCPHVGGGLAVNNNGNEVALHALVGTGKAESAGLYYLGSDNAGKDWGTPYKLGKDMGVHGDIAVMNDNQVLAVWDMGGPDGMAIYASHSSNDGSNWTDDKLLSNPKANGSHPRVVAIQSGFIVFWTEMSETGEKVLISKRLEI